MRTILCVMVLMCVAATTKPATTQADEVASLRAIIASLQQQIADLKRENLALQKKVQAAPPAPVAAAAGQSTFLSRAKRNTASMPGPQSTKLLDRGKRRDAVVGAYLAAHQVKPEIAKAMWEGRVALGMSKEQAELIGRLKIDSESADSQWYQFDPDPNAVETGTSGVLFADGLIVRIHHPD